MPDIQASSPAPRGVTPRVAEMLAAVRPRYEPRPPADVAAGDAVATRERVRPANGIVRLPNYVVRERKLPTPKTWETLSPETQARLGMEKYIGSERGLDRGVLNLFTVASLWKKLPVIGQFPLLGFYTNEERGLMFYREAKKKEELENWLDLMPRGAGGEGPSPDKPAAKK